MNAPNKLEGQAGPQIQFLSCTADICIFGGAAYGGKSYALALEASRYIGHKKDMAGIIFRRTIPQILQQGGIFDTCKKILGPGLGAKFVEGSQPKAKLPIGNELVFSGMQHEKDAQTHDGAAYPFIGIDEVQRFTEKQFWYIQSRMRPSGECTIKPYLRATCNPVHEDDPTGGWLRKLIDWWIDEDGFAIPERSGVVRYFTRQDGKVLWVDKDWRDEDGDKPKSFTFISSKITDNKIGMARDPSYRATLKSLERVERGRLLDGNWNITEADGMFDRTWFNIKSLEELGAKSLDDLTRRMTGIVRYWDKAATEKSEDNPDPDWTVGALGGWFDKEFIILDIERFRKSPKGNEDMLRQVADIDGLDVPIGIEQEPGSGGKETVYNYINNVLELYEVYRDLPKGDKVLRCRPWCAHTEKGKVTLLKASWNRKFLVEAENFPNGKKDQIDAVSGLWKMLSKLGMAPKAKAVREVSGEYDNYY